MTLTLTTPIRAQTPEQFYTYVQSLRRANETAPDSKAAKGLKLHVQDNGRVIIRCTRDTKTLTQLEVTNLAVEYTQDEVVLTALFTKRKFTITNDAGEVTNAKPKSRKRAAPKRNAQHDQDNAPPPCPDQLFVAGADSNVHAQSGVQLAETVAQGG